jgi:hypothetical protein
MAISPYPTLQAVTRLMMPLFSEYRSHNTKRSLQKRSHRHPCLGYIQTGHIGSSTDQEALNNGCDVADPLFPVLIISQIRRSGRSSDRDALLKEPCQGIGSFLEHQFLCVYQF